MTTIDAEINFRNRIGETGFVSALYNGATKPYKPVVGHIILDTHKNKKTLYKVVGILDIRNFNDRCNTEILLRNIKKDGSLGATVKHFVNHYTRRRFMGYESDEHGHFKLTSTNKLDMDNLTRRIEGRNSIPFKI